MPNPSPVSALRLSLVSLALFACGCGAETYQERIAQNTVPLFRLQKELNENLGPRIAKGEVLLRLPPAFSEIPAPKKPKPGEPERRDPRLPPGLNATNLVGLLGGYKGKMQAVVDPSAGGGTVEATVFAYVLSNRSLLTSKDASAAPQKFDTMLLNAISAGLGQGSVSATNLKPIEVGGEAFQPHLRYETMSFDTALNGVPMRYEVYIRRAQPLQIGVIFVVPKEADRGERLRDRIDYSLQSLRIETPTAASSAGAATTGTATEARPAGGPGF